MRNGHVVATHASALVGADMAVDVLVRFIGDASSVTAATAKVESSSNSMKKWAKGVGAALGAVFAVKVIDDWISSAEESERVSAGLKQALKNAGDATGEWDKKAEHLASTLMKKTAIDDEQIKSAMTILATFHSLPGATGQTIDAFERATQAALDLARAGFGDANSAAKQLGKALEDPVKGLTALKKAGVNFTADQKEQIKAMVEAGDKAGAMNLILQEVERQVGGVAAKTKTSGQEMRVAWGETKEALGNVLLPAVQEVVPWLQKLADWIQKNTDVLGPAAAAFVTVAAATWLWNIALHANPVVLVMDAIILLSIALFELWKNWDTVWTWIKENPAIAIVVAMFAPFIAIIFAAVGAIHWLWQNWDMVWGWIKQAATDASNWVIDAFQNVLGFFQSITPTIENALSNLWFIISEPFRQAWYAIRDIFNNIVGDVKGAFNDIIDGVREVWNIFARGWNSIELEVPGIDIPLFGEVGGFTVGLPDIPQLAKGGIITGPTLALLGEGINDEAVVPLDSGFGNTYHISVTVAPGTSPAEVGAALIDNIRAYERVAGRAWRGG